MCFRLPLEWSQEMCSLCSVEKFTTKYSWLEIQCWPNRLNQSIEHLPVSCRICWNSHYNFTHSKKCGGTANRKCWMTDWENLCIEKWNEESTQFQFIRLKCASIGPNERAVKRSEAKGVIRNWYLTNIHPLPAYSVSITVHMVLYICPFYWWTESNYITRVTELRNLVLWRRKTEKWQKICGFCSFPGGGGVACRHAGQWNVFRAS